MNKLIVLILVLIVVVSGIFLLIRPIHNGVLGTTTGTVGQQRTPIGQLDKTTAGKSVQIEGIIKQECPHTGCWAIIKDDSGEIRIDTKKGGFSLPLHREGSKVRVIGEVEVKENGDLQLNALSAEL